MAAVDEAAHERDAGRPGAADDENPVAHGGDAGTTGAAVGVPGQSGERSGTSGPEVAGDRGQGVVGQDERRVGDLGLRLHDLRIPQPGRAQRPRRSPATLPLEPQPRRRFSPVRMSTTHTPQLRSTPSPVSGRPSKTCSRTCREPDERERSANASPRREAGHARDVGARRRCRGRP